MPDPFLGPIFERMAREQRAGMRIGTLTAIDTGDASVTVSLAGDSVPGVRWVGSYTPVVGDMVVVARVEASWVVLGKMSKQLGVATVVYGSVTVLPETSWQWDSASGWSSAIDHVEQDGAGGTATRAGLFSYGGLGGAGVPAGATVLSANLTLVRGHPVYDSGAPLVSPTIHGNAYAAGSGTPTGSPALVSGYGPWRPGTLTYEQQATWEIPSAWLTALLAATITGFTFYTTAAAENMTVKAGFGAGLSGAIQVNYTTPA